MKNTTLTLILLLIAVLLSTTTAAQDYTRWGLPEGAVLRLGKGKINEIACSPDGALLAVASSIGVWLYETETFQEVVLLPAPPGTWADNEYSYSFTNSVRFSPDGRTLAIVNTISGAELAISSIRLWDVTTRKYLKTLTDETGATRVRFSPDGQTLAGYRQAVWLWDVASGELRQTLTGHTGGVSSVHFNPDGQTLFSTSGNKTIRLWDVNTGTLLKTFTEYTVGEPHEHDFSLDFSYGPRISLHFSPDRQKLASGSNGDNIIQLWDVITGERRQTLISPSHGIASVCFSPNGQILASGGVNGSIQLWDVITGQFRNTVIKHTGAVNSVCFSPDGQTLASGRLSQMEGDGTTIQLWDIPSGILQKTLNSVTDGPVMDGVSSTDGAVLSVCFSPDGNTLASGYTGTAEGLASGSIWLWDVATGEPLTSLIGHTNAVTSVCFSLDGHTLASGSSDGTALLWDLASPTSEENR